MRPPDSKWIDKRAVVHHDQVRAFKTCLDAIRTKTDNKSISKKELVEKLKSWEELRTELVWLINNFESYQTLISFLRFPPLNKVDKDQRKILVMAIKNTNTNFKNIACLPLISDFISKADEIYLNLWKVKAIQLDHLYYDGLSSELSGFYDLIVKLSNELEHLPKEILI